MKITAIRNYEPSRTVSKSTEAEMQGLVNRKPNQNLIQLLLKHTKQLKDLVLEHF